MTAGAGSAPDFTEFWGELSRCGGDLQCLLEVIARRVADVVGEGSVLTVLGDDGQTLRPVAFHHADPELLARMRGVLSDSPFRVGEGVVGAVAQDRKAVLLSNVDAKALTPLLSQPSRSFADRNPIQSMMIVPLLAFGELFGTLGAMRMASDAPYTRSDLAVLEALAERAALAIADARPVSRPLGLTEYESIFRHSLDGVLFTLPDGQILAANPAACTILQRSETEICRLGRAGLTVGDDPRTKKAVAERSLTGSARAEIPMIRPNGSTFLAEVSSTTFSGPDGTIRACVIFRDVSEQAAQRDLLERQSRDLERLVEEDVLSGLLNRRGFMLAAERALGHAARDQVPVQLVFCDLDSLKSINDQFGHKVGDEVLRRLGASIGRVIRAVDVGARLSGDEFVVLLYGATREETAEVLDRLTADFDDPSRPGPPATFSAGVAERPTGSTRTLDELLQAADRQMYTRKALRRIERRPPR